MTASAAVAFDLPLRDEVGDCGLGEVAAGRDEGDCWRRWAVGDDGDGLARVGLARGGVARVSFPAREGLFVRAILDGEGEMEEDAVGECSRLEEDDADPDATALGDGDLDRGVD